MGATGLASDGASMNRKDVRFPFDAELERLWEKHPRLRAEVERSAAVEPPPALERALKALPVTTGAHAATWRWRGVGAAVGSAVALFVVTISLHKGVSPLDERSESRERQALLPDETAPLSEPHTAASGGADQYDAELGDALVGDLERLTTDDLLDDDLLDLEVL